MMLLVVATDLDHAADHHPGITSPAPALPTGTGTSTAVAATAATVAAAAGFAHPWELLPRLPSTAAAAMVSQLARAAGTALYLSKYSRTG